MDTFETTEDNKAIGRLTPKKVVEILKKHGTVINAKEAELVLDFLYSLGKLALQQQIRHEESRSIFKSKY